VHAAEAVLVNTDMDVFITAGLRKSFLLDNQCGFSCYLAGA
jgi:hypothetical protein